MTVVDTIPAGPAGKLPLVGKLFFNILATFAEFEVDLLRMRTREGMAAARSKGRLKGRQPKLSTKQQNELRRMHTSGDYTITDLAEIFNISRPITVTITARSLDAAGARFDVAFDTHSGDINLDVAQAGKLLINGAPAPPGSWSGGGPVGHHRAGVLSYAAAVPPGATVELRISGLPQAASATWTAP